MQKGILLMLDDQFLREIDAAFPLAGYSDRSTFIREAVIKYLAELGVHVPISYKAAPPRIGTAKGGRPKKADVVAPLVSVPDTGLGKKSARKTAI